MDGGPGRRRRRGVAVFQTLNLSTGSSGLRLLAPRSAVSRAGARRLDFAGLVWRGLLFFSLVGLLGLAHLPALAATKAWSDPRDHILERAWLEDSTNRLGPDQVSAMTWTPYSGALRRGYTASTTWLRLKIAAPDLRSQRNPDRARQLVLRMMPGHLDEIALFDPRFPESRRSSRAMLKTGAWANTDRSIRIWSSQRRRNRSRSCFGSGQPAIMDCMSRR